MRRTAKRLGPRVLAVGLASGLGACATAPPPPPGDPVAAVRAQAATDLSCPAHLLRVSPIGAETVGSPARPQYMDVEGCSLHVIYEAKEAGYVLSSPKQVTPAHAPDHVDVR
ncbi:MAG TPA: hypothetical protein VHE35_24675 [Kofleriaceae bacterium]|nr:hypothetical protein [Kofleriaceae bacterium]